jgi:hypothetical protein
MPESHRVKFLAIAFSSVAMLSLAACSHADATGPGAPAHRSHQHKSGAGTGLGQGSPTPVSVSPTPTSQSTPTSQDGAAGSGGLTGAPVVLAKNVSFSGYDAATDAAGRSYLGWISAAGGANRKVHLCTLPPGARQCLGGVQAIDSLGDASAQGLRVLVTSAGQVTLVWMYDTAASENGPEGSELATATASPGHPLAAAKVQAKAPSFGTMLDAAAGPNGSVWVITEGSSVKGIQVRPGLGQPAIDLKTPYPVGAARLSFDHGRAVIVIQKDGAISSPVAYASFRDGGFSAFRLLAHTWTSDAQLGLTDTTTGVRLVTSQDNASYHPVAWSWSGAGFDQPTLTGDLTNCSPSSHDLVSDNSGRAADVSIECDGLAIANLADSRHASVARVPVTGTFAGGTPQLTTTPRGTGWVTWSIESTDGDELLAAPVVLPAGLATASATASGNQVLLSGPASCLPPVDVRVGVNARPAGNWQAAPGVLRLNGAALSGGTVPGASLTPGQRYTLTGSAGFTSGSSHATATASLTFQSCPKS